MMRALARAGAACLLAACAAPVPEPAPANPLRLEFEAEPFAAHLAGAGGAAADRYRELFRAAVDREPPARGSDTEGALLRERAAALRRVVAARSDVVAARVLRLLPDGADAPLPPRLAVLPCAGLGVPGGTAVAGDGEGRAVLVDVGGGSGAFDLGDLDGAGERLERALAPELFHLAYEDWLRRSAGGLPARGIERALFSLVNEGVAAWLAMAPEQRFDEQGRRRPVADVQARAAIELLERNLPRLLDARTPAEEYARLEWSVNAPKAGASWGTHAAALMVDAVDRFGPPGRLRLALRRGAADLFRAYGEVCGAHAAIPRLDPAVGEAIPERKQGDPGAADPGTGVVPR